MKGQRLRFQAYFRGSIAAPSEFLNLEFGGRPCRLLAPRGSYVLPSLTLCRAQVMGTAPSSPLTPSPFPICRQEPSQVVRSDASSFFSKLDSHPAPLLLLPPAALPTAASHSRTAASHRGIDSSRLAVPCTEPGRPQLGVADPASHGLAMASSSRLPAHLVDRCTSTLACSSSTNSPATSW